MSYATGTETRAAAVKGSTWDIAAACGAGDGILVHPPTFKKERPLIEDDSLGAYFPHEAAPGGIKVEGELPCYLRYDGLDLLVALAMGATAGAPVQQGGTSAYAQSITLAGLMDGLFATLALHNGVNIDEYPSMKLTGMKLRGRVGEPVEVLFKGIASDRITDSSTNTPASFASVTIAEESNRVLMSHALFRINDASGAALGSGDEVYPSSFELDLTRPMAGAHVAGAGHDRVDEPVAEGPPEIRLKLEFPRYSSSEHFEDWAGSVAKKMQMVFTGGLIEDTYYREFKVSLPHLIYKDVDLPMERGALRHTLEFACLATDSAPSGMSGVLDPFQVDVVNTRSTDVLG